MDPSYPWGGVAVTDNFFGSDNWAERPTPHGEGGGGIVSHRLTLGPYGSLSVGDITKFGITEEDSKALSLIEEEFTQNLTPRKRRKKQPKLVTAGAI